MRLFTSLRMLMLNLLMRRAIRLWFCRVLIRRVPFRIVLMRRFLLIGMVLRLYFGARLIFLRSPMLLLMIRTICVRLRFVLVDMMGMVSTRRVTIVIRRRPVFAVIVVVVLYCLLRRGLLTLCLRC